MSMEMSITGFMSGKIQTNTLWRSMHEEIRLGVAEQMRKAQPELKAAAQGAIGSAFRVRSGSFPKAWATKVYTDKRDQMPAVVIKSKIFWMGMQEFGGRISGKRGLLIPFAGLRIGFKAWARLLERLRAAKQTFFRNIGGRLILFARAGGVRGQNVRRLKSMTVSGIPAMRRLAKGEAFPVATFVRAVNLRPRYSLERAIEPVARKIARSIEQNVGLT